MATTLISFVGDTDPIRNYHDGPIVHISRVNKPEKIVLVHSERTIIKHESIVLALKSIPDYDPEIIKHEEIIPNNEVFLFDRMFDKFSKIVNQYHRDENEVILNLTSGTAQVISAMFSINRIQGLDVKAFQVSTPVKDSNTGIRMEDKSEIDTLIELNEDNSKDFIDRTIEDKGESFKTTMLRQTMISLLEHYNYQGVFDISVKEKVTSKSKRKKLNRQLDEITNFVSYQKLLPDVKDTCLEEAEKRLLNAALLIDLQTRRNLTSEVLIRVQNFTEKAIEYYIENEYEGIIEWKKGKPYLNKSGTSEIVKYINDEFDKMDMDGRYFDYSRFLSLPLYVLILKYHCVDEELMEYINKINGAKVHRNNVAHDLKEINKKEVNIITLRDTCWLILTRVMTNNKDTIDKGTIEEKWYNYFDELNQRFIDLIQS